MAAKETTNNDYRERANKVIQYIHNHLNEKLEIETLANVACYSPFHFHRIISAFLNESLMAYDTRIRLETAAQLILYSGLQMTDIAYKMGYVSLSSFSKAFKKQFGAWPSEYKNHYDNTLYLKHLKHSKAMNKIDLQPRISNEPKWKVIYVNSIGPYEGEGTEKSWKTVCKFAGRNGLLDGNTEFIGISYDDPNITNPSKLRYDACLTITQNVKPEGVIGTNEIAGGNYAVFMYRGPYEGFKNVYDYIFATWLPDSNCELRDVPCFEKYLNSPDDVPPDELKQKFTYQ